MGEAVKEQVIEAIDGPTGVPTKADESVEPCNWYEEVIDDDLKWSFALNRWDRVSYLFVQQSFCISVKYFVNLFFFPLISVLHRGASKYQDIALLDTKHFGKVSIIIIIIIKFSIFFGWKGLILIISFFTWCRLWWLMGRCKVPSRMNSFIMNAWSILHSFAIQSKSFSYKNLLLSFKLQRKLNYFYKKVYDF